MQNSNLSDIAATAEAKRLLQVVSAQRAHQNCLFGCENKTIEFDENSGWNMGMLALFRYARGEAIPAFVVQDFLDELLKMMFCGIANNAMALPPFRRMADKPWAVAWRLAELRMAFEGEIAVDVSQLAHLLGEPVQVIERRLTQRGFDSSEHIPETMLREIYDALRNDAEARSNP